MKKSLLLFLCLVGLPTCLSAQGTDCAERDYKCQLDVRMKALQADPKNPENYYNLGIVFQRMGAHTQAIESFTMYVNIPGLKPEYQADGYNNRGISQRAIKRFDLAVADYTRAIELFPLKSAQFLVNRANAHASSGKRESALLDYDAAMKADPKYAQAYAQRGLLNADMSRIADALTDFAKSIELDPKYPEPYYNRGVIYSERGEFARAIPDYDKYISLVTEPNYKADGYLNRGIAHGSIGQLQKAVDDLSKAIELRPNSPNAYKARAITYRNMKKNDLAEADEKKAGDLSKSNKTP